MSTLIVYPQHFTSLNRAPGPTWTETTKRKAPHKPLLLLTVLDLVHRGVIDSPFIDVTGNFWPAHQNTGANSGCSDSQFKKTAS